MDQKKFAIGFVIFAIIALVVWGVNKISSSPSPAPAAQSESSKNNLGTSTSSAQPATTNMNTQNNKKTYTEAPAVLPVAELTNKKAVIETNKGIIEFEIFPEAPKTATNFITLATDGFYDGLKFHRVVPGFVIQGGDPLGNGTGGPGYKFEDEKVTRDYNKGIVAMANSGPNTNGSQFFIMLEDNPLPKNYTIFGKVTKGQDVVSKIVQGDVMEKITIEPLK